MITAFPLIVSRIVRQTAKAVTLHLTTPEGTTLPYTPGQFLNLTFTFDGAEHTRSYSLCTTPRVDDYMAVTVKETPTGTVSAYCNQRLTEGTRIMATGPNGVFTAEAAKSNPRWFVLFAGGSGITPIISIIKQVLHSPAYADKKVALIYANKNEQEIIFREKLQTMASEFADRFVMIDILEAPSAAWHGLTGMLNADVTVKMVEQIPVVYPLQGEYYICGPAGLKDAVKAGLQTLRIPAELIHVEDFGPVHTEAKPEGTESSKVTVKYRKKVYEFEVQKGRHILETALEHKYAMPFSCQGGVCTACMGKLVSGKVDMGDQSALTDSEVERGYVLTCVGKPITPEVVIEIE